ncbi:MAG: hypothetical protein ACE5QV_03565 [Fidelibacterota bacterium]
MREFKVNAQKFRVDNFKNSLLKTLEVNGFEERFHRSDISSMDVYEFVRSNQMISITVDESGIENLELKIQAKGVNIKNIITDAIRMTVLTEINVLLSPYTTSMKMKQFEKTLSDFLLSNLENLIK